MYRPEGWEKRANERVEELIQSPFSDVEIAYYEAGADAMLEALKKDGMNIGKGCISCVIVLPPPFGLTEGKVVFIPEG